jgi:hypothetical protein
MHSVITVTILKNMLISRPNGSNLEAAVDIRKEWALANTPAVSNNGLILVLSLVILKAVFLRLAQSLAAGSRSSAD